MIAVIEFTLVRGTVTDLLVTERGFVTEVSAVLMLAVGFSIVLYGIDLAVIARDGAYTQTILFWFITSVAAVGLILVPLMTALSSGGATAAVASIAIVGGGTGLFVGHLLWGGLVGTLSSTLPLLPDRQAIRDQVLGAIGR